MSSRSDEEEKKRQAQADMQAKERRQREWVAQQQNDYEQNAQAILDQQMKYNVSLADGSGPADIKKFLRDPLNKAIKDNCIYDEKTGALSFPPNKGGIDALADYLKKFPSSQIKGVGFKDTEQVRKTLKQMKEAGIDIKKNIGSIEIGGETYTGKRLKDLIDKLSPPRPTHNQQ